MLPMTTLRICCNKLLLAVTLAMMASGAAGHAVHTDGASHGKPEHAGVPGALQINKAQSHLSVDDLIQAYSLLGDDALLDQAQNKLPVQQASWSVAQRLQAAWLAQSRHEFANARALLVDVLAQQPSNGQAWLLEASTAKVVGDLAAARRACGFVVQSVSVEAAVTCFAALAETQQQRAAALSRLRKLPPPRAGSGLAAWRWSVQAELAQDAGNLAEAEALLRRAIAISPAVQTRTLLMDLLLAQARFAEVLQLSPEGEPVPALVIRHLLARRGLGEDISAATAHLNTRFQTWVAQGDYRHAREMAMFYIDVEPRPDLAFKLATRNATLQREPEDMALLHRAKNMQRAQKIQHAVTES